MNENTEDEGKLLSKGPCEDCGSSDACCTYEETDGRTHTHCFSCGAHHAPEGSGGERQVSTMADAIIGRHFPLTKRNIAIETCRKFDVQVGKTSKGEFVTLFNYRDRENGFEMVAQKLQYAERPDERPIIGNIDKAGLFGQHLWKSGGERLVITEGEIDCLSVAQAFGLSWPVVSIKRGCNGALKDLKQSLEWADSFRTIVLWFDNDDVGRAAAQQCARIFTPGKVRIAETPQ